MHKQPFFEKKVRNIVVMVLSQLLLTLFVSYWLRSQYQNEKEKLNQELSQHYYHTGSELVDKQIYKYIVTPILQCKDSSAYEHVEFAGLTIEPERTTLVTRSIVEYLNENQSYRDKLKEYFKNELLFPEPDDTTLSILGTLRNYMYQHNINVSAFRYRKAKDNSNNAFDETLFQKMYSSKLEYYNYDIEINWIPDSTSLQYEVGDIAVSRYNYDTKQQELAVVFEEYNIHLLKIILPQFIFAFILLSLSAFALIFTYRSYVKQIRLNILRTDFINNITHELKIPVATAKAALEALRSFGLKADASVTEEYLEMVAREMNRLDSLTSKVLEHAKMEKHKHYLNPEETDLSSFIGCIVNALNMLYTAKGIQINFIKPQDAIKLHIDRLYVEGVLKNLIDNSIKYGGEKVNIQIKIWEKDQQVFISVMDNGPGIPQEYLNKVFDKFFRIPTGDKHNIKGYGLGLSFAALVMKQHNGCIKVTNIKTGGCEFILQFPLTKNDNLKQ